MTLSTPIRRILVRPMIRGRRGPARTDLDRAALGRQRIAFVKLDGIGDFVLATALLQICRAKWPRADITLFCRNPVGQLARQQFPDWSVVELPARSRPLKHIFLQGAARGALENQKPFDLLLDL